MSKKVKKDVLTVDTVKCSKKDTIVIRKSAPKSAVKLSGKIYERSLKQFKKNGLSPEERLLKAVFGNEFKGKGLPKEERTKEKHDDMYSSIEKFFKGCDDCERKFNNGRKFVCLSEKETKRIDSLRKQGLSVKAIAKEMHRSDHTVREYLNGSSRMSANAIEKAVKKGFRPAHLARVTKRK